jgi:ferrous iron transport protein B
MSAQLENFDQLVVNSSPRPLTIAVAGNPNAGKTTLFNALTGLRQRVANYPGVTVERKEGLWSLGTDGLPANLIDLPGLYSLEATSIDEEIARDILLGRNVNIAQPDVVVLVVDATNLARNLYLLTQLLEIKSRVVVALTMFDLAERGRIRIDVEKLGIMLGVPVIPVSARQQRGLGELAETVLKVAARESGGQQPVSGPSGAHILAGKAAAFLPLPPAMPQHAPSPAMLFTADPTWQAPHIDRYRWIETVIAATVSSETNRQHRTTQRIDALVTHRLAGPVVLFFVMLLVFQTIFSWAELPMTLIERLFNLLGDTTRVHLPPGVFTDLIVSGVIPGVGGVLMFLPQILLLFFFITLLEDTGYMARAAFLMDRLMRGVGLHGKAFVPLLSSFACAVPGIMATRTIENPKDRLATIMIAPFMSCSARLPVYTLMIAAFFSGRQVGGLISVGALIILAMYLLGIAVAVIVAWILKHTILKAPSPPFLLELPPYRLPNPRNVAHSLLSRSGIFLKRAGTVILAISILLWGLVAFPRSLPSASPGAAAARVAAEQVENSYAGRAGRWLEPVIRPLGFDWKIGIALISSFAARETVISTLSIVYNVGEQPSDDSASLIQAIRNARRPDGSPVWTPLVGLSLMIFFVLACQCMSTVAVVRRETNSWRWPLFMVCYMLVLAYVASLVTYQGGHLLGFS